FTITDSKRATAVKGRILIDHAFFETCNRSNHFKDRSRRVVVLDGFVAQRAVWVVSKFVPESGRNSARKLGWIERGTRDHRQDLPVSRVDRHERSDLVAKRFGRSQLKVLVDRENQ